MKLNLLIFTAAILLVHLNIFADVAGPSCSDYDEIFFLDKDTEKNTNSYSDKTGYYSGGPIYAGPIKEGEISYYFPISNPFSIPENYKNLLISNHWCQSEISTRLGSEWGDPYDWRCSCRTAANYWDWDSIIEEDLPLFHTPLSYEFIYENTFDSRGSLPYLQSYIVTDKIVSHSSYGESCLLNDAIWWFRFNYLKEHPETKEFPRFFMDPLRGAILYTCSLEGLVYKVWRVCENKDFNEVIFENYDSPKKITFADRFSIPMKFADFGPCTLYVETNDPYQRIISYTNVWPDEPTSEGSERLTIKQEGVNISVEPSSDAWWTASPTYRAKKISDKKYEVSTLLRPWTDECVPPGKYIYFVTSANCVDVTSECINYAGITISENEENKDCPQPEYKATVLKNELDKVLIKKPFLEQENPPSYHTYHSTCAILPGEIMNRYLENYETLPPHLAYQFSGTKLLIENCGEDELMVKSIKTECEDPRKSIEILESIKISSAETKEIGLNGELPSDCYHNCNIEIVSNDQKKEKVSSSFLASSSSRYSPFVEGTKASIEGTVDHIYTTDCKEKAKLNISFNNLDCLDIVNPSIIVRKSLIAPVTDTNPTDITGIRIDIAEDDVEIIGTSELSFEMSADDDFLINFSGSIKPEQSVKIKIPITFSGCDENKTNDNLSLPIYISNDFHDTHQCFYNDIRIQVISENNDDDTETDDIDPSDSNGKNDVEFTETNDDSPEKDSRGCSILTL